MGFSRQEYWSGLPFPSPVDHVLSELSTMTRLSWVAPRGMAHSFIGLDKVMVHVMRLVAAAAKSLQSCPTQWDPIEGSPLGCPWDSPGQNTGVGCHCLLQMRLVSFLWLWFSFCLRRIRGSWKLSDGRDWLQGKLGLVLMVSTMLSISLIQFKLMGGAVFPPC